MLNEAQASALETKIADARARQRQDKAHPLLINAKDGRLMPNVPRIRNNKKSHYIVYTGDPKATLESRMRWLQTLTNNGARRVIDTSEEAPFDIGKATKQELVDFALAEYQTTLDVKTDHRVLRSQVKTLAEQHDTLMSKAKTAPEDLA